MSKIRVDMTVGLASKLNFSSGKRGVRFSKTVLLAAVAGVYSNRTRFVADDAVRQIAADYQKVRNEAQKGLGPTSSASGISPGDVIFGQAVEFTKNCSPNIDCMRVQKLKKQESMDMIEIYETYDIPFEEGYKLNFDITGSCVTDFVSCYTPPAGPESTINIAPILFGGADDKLTSDNKLTSVIQNGSRGQYAFSTSINLDPKASDISNYTSDRTGKLRIALYRPDSPTQPPADAPFRYYMTIDLSGSNEVKVEQLK